MVTVHKKLTSLNIFSKFKQIYNYLYFCCNLPVKFAIFFLTVPIVFYFYKQKFTAQLQQN